MVLLTLGSTWEEPATTPMILLVNIDGIVVLTRISSLDERQGL